MQIADIHKVKAYFARLLDQVLAGEEVIVARSGKRMVRLTPLNRVLQPRQGGQLRGKLWVAEDFDTPDPEIEKLFYGNGS